MSQVQKESYSRHIGLSYVEASRCRKKARLGPQAVRVSWVQSKMDQEELTKISESAISERTDKKRIRWPNGHSTLEEKRRRRCGVDVSC